MWTEITANDLDHTFFHAETRDAIIKKHGDSASSSVMTTRNITHSLWTTS